MDHFTETSIIVVAAIVRRNSLVLLARRKDGSLSGFWEFPGGKIEPGETPEAALERELREELGVESRIGIRFGESEHVSKNGALRIVFYLCELLSEPQAGEAHDSLMWVGRDDWKRYDVAPADVPMLEMVFKEQE